jgi:hypothetical protein
VFVKRSEGSFSLIVASQGLAALLFVATALPAQPATPAQVVKQEVPDNPLTHLALGVQCQNCHTNPEPGKLMAFPATGTCMQCHATIAKDKPDIQRLAEYDKSQKPVPWVRVYTVLPGVQWNHRKHVDAGVQCEACHGQVRQMDVMAEVTSVVTMASCQGCHAKYNAKKTCPICHTFADPSLWGSTR